MLSHYYVSELSDTYPSSNGMSYGGGFGFLTTLAFQSDDEMGNQGSLPYPPSA